MILYNFGPFGDLPDSSPFCLKVDAYFRMAGIDFESSPGMQNIENAPKGKLPFIEDDGDIVADSTFILEYLKSKYGDPLDANLSAEQKAVSHAFIKMLDENLYWCGLWSRWDDDAGWAIIKEVFFAGAPEGIAETARKQMVQTIYGHGLGRHSTDEIMSIMCNDLNALADYLGDKNYFFGDSPSTLDAAAYGFLAQFILAPLDFPMYLKAREYKNLVAYCERVKQEYYS